MFKLNQTSKDCGHSASQIPSRGADQPGSLGERNMFEQPNFP